MTLKQIWLVSAVGMIVAGQLVAVIFGVADPMTRSMVVAGLKIGILLFAIQHALAGVFYIGETIRGPRTVSLSEEEVERVANEINKRLANER